MFGMPETEIAKARADFAVLPTAPDALPIHPENIRAVRLFLAMATQWDCLALSTLGAARVVRTGLKYPVLDFVAAKRGLGEVTEDDFLRVQILEGEALNAWTEASQ